MKKFNLKLVEESIRNLLIGIGEDPTRDGLIDTPQRVAKMYKELCEKSADKTLHLNKTFSFKNDELIIIKDISFYSLCEHHIMPFIGKVHIAYKLDKEIIGLSKIYREIECLSKGLNIQENLNTKIFESFVSLYKDIKLIILIESEHLCVAMRGIKKENSKFITIRKTSNISDSELNFFLRIIRTKACSHYLK
ncbi:MAG: GTP cyclohydrolase I [Oscillospiraceae bacterium]|jgi:GTP cyclohydrolase I|nr:GTP cyclohydrolase I [Oscillospiraceae bacterium]